MASLAQIEAELGALPAGQRATFRRIFQAILTDLRIGHPQGVQPDPCVNFGAGFFHGTTASTPDDEFSITHGFGRTPYLVVPVLPLDVLGAQIVPLTVTRVADDKRIYLSSSVADAPVTVYLEG